MPFRTTRRKLLQTAGAAALAPAIQARVNNDSEGFKLGVASYSLRKLSRADAIKTMQALRTPYINIKDFHAAVNSSQAELKQIRKEFEDAGLIVLGVGNVSFQKNDDAEIRRNFEYAKALGASLMVMAPTRETLPKVEAMVKEYNIRAAIHNHGPEDKHFPAPQDVLKAVKDMDPRVGLCIDIGHTARTGVNVVEALRLAGSRLHDMHVKDLKDSSDKNSQVAVGEGILPIPAIFRTLRDMNYQGGAMLEYEINAEAPLAGMQYSLAYMRGVLDGIRTA